MSNIEKYLNKIVDYMVRHSKDNNFPFDNSVISFGDYCRQTFGLTDDEVDYVYYRYKTYYTIVKIRNFFDINKYLI